MHYGRIFEICPKIIRSFSFNNPIKVIRWLEIVKKPYYLAKRFKSLNPTWAYLEGQKCLAIFRQNLEFTTIVLWRSELPPKKTAEEEKKERARLSTY